MCRHYGERDFVAGIKRICAGSCLTTVQIATSARQRVFQRDPELDQFSTYQEWMRAAAAKHGMEFGLRMAALQNEMMMRANKNL